MQHITVPETFKHDHPAFAKWYWELLKSSIGESAAADIEEIAKTKGADTAFNLSVFDKGEPKGNAQEIYKAILKYLEQKI